MLSEAEIEERWTSVQNVLCNESFVKYSQSYDRRQLIQLANEINGPRMVLIHYEQIIKMQRIPHSDENLTVDALNAITEYGAERCEIFMVSHRWLRPRVNSNESHPDSIDHRKAKAINEFSKWRIDWVRQKHHFKPEIFYWIDFCCIDQHNLQGAIPLLPLWVACCERFLRIETDDYSERAWCRLEPLLSYVFQFADHHTIIHLDFKCPTNGIYSGRKIEMIILDPSEGKTTDESDLHRIGDIVKLAKIIEINNPIVNFGTTTIKCFEL